MFILSHKKGAEWAPFPKSLAVRTLPSRTCVAEKRHGSENLYARRFRPTRHLGLRNNGYLCAEDGEPNDSANESRTKDCLCWDAHQVSGDRANHCADENRKHAYLPLVFGDSLVFHREVCSASSESTTTPS